MKTVFKISMLLFIIFLACKKDKKTEEPINITPPPPAQPAFGFKKGNWWVYTCTSTHTFIPFNRDSVIVKEDSVMNGKTYFQFQSFTTPPSPNSFFPLINSWVRDSGNYIVDNSGKIIASTNQYIGNFDHDSVFYMASWAYNYEAYELPGTFTLNCNSNTYQGKVNVRKILPHPIYNYTYKNNYSYLSNSLGYFSFESGMLNDTNILWNCKLLHHHFQ